MPIYEYERDTCGLRFERSQSITADPVKVCPECGGLVRRLINRNASFILKGSGFYATDYRKSRSSRCRESPCCGREPPYEKKPSEK